MELEQPKWRWYQEQDAYDPHTSKSYLRYSLKYDGESINVAVVTGSHNGYVVEFMGNKAIYNSLEDAFEVCEEAVKSTSFLPEGDFEGKTPTATTIPPSINSYLKQFNLGVINSAGKYFIVTYGGVTEQVIISVMALDDIKTMYKYITDYFNKYPDSEQKIKKQWDKNENE